METIWKSVQELGGRRWLMSSFLPALLFVASSGALYVDTQLGWSELVRSWRGLSGDLRFAAFAVGLLLVIVVAVTLDAGEVALLRWGEGYWNYRWFGWLCDRRKMHYQKALEHHQCEFSALRVRKEQGKLTHSEQQALQRLEETLHYFPPDQAMVMPTMLGNIMRSAEEHARVRYGLDPIATWFRLYPSLSAPLQESLADNCAVLDLDLRVMVLGTILGLVGSALEWCCFGWLRGLLSLVLAALLVRLAHQWAIQTAKVYSDLVRTSFDLHRFDLYESLHLDYPPQSGDEERKRGERLSEFLWRGDAMVHYHHKAEDSER